MQGKLQQLTPAAFVQSAFEAFCPRRADQSPAVCKKWMLSTFSPPRVTFISTFPPALAPHCPARLLSHNFVSQKSAALAMPDGKMRKVIKVERGDGDSEMQSYQEEEAGAGCDRYLSLRLESDACVTYSSSNHGQILAGDLPHDKVLKARRRPCAVQADTVNDIAQVVAAHIAVPAAATCKFDVPLPHTPYPLFLPLRASHLVHSLKPPPRPFC